MFPLNKRIEQVRKLNGLKQAEFAGKLGITRGHVSMIETGAATPSDQLIYLIALTFGISKEWLLEGRGPLRPNRIPIDFTNDPELLALLGADIEGKYISAEARILQILRRWYPTTKGAPS